MRIRGMARCNESIGSMSGIDPLATQYDTTDSIVAELIASGFEAIHEFGRGGFGVVFRCLQPSLDRMVAVKVLTAALGEENRARFLREQRATGRLSGHPNIVNIFQAGSTEGGRPFIVMPYYPQDSIEARIRRSGPLPLDEVLLLGVRIAGALGSAHHLGIFHRDVKPANILITDYGEPVLADFGIAHFAGAYQTGTDMLTGSPAFIAPEVVTGAPPSAAADVYGLGATLFAALTGHAAFERRNGEQVIAQFLRITSEPVPTLGDFGIAEDVGNTIERAMAGDPSARPSAVELAGQLQESQYRHGLRIDKMSLSSEFPQNSSLASTFVQSRAESSVPQGERSRGVLFSSGRAGELPLELTSFIGRRRELSEAKNLLSTARLVTLTGMGGVGKTRLASRIAVAAERNFSDGVRFVELAELRDASLLVSVVQGALAMRDRSARPALEVLADFLAQRKLLLVLDNCEHLVDVVAQLVEFLLRTCPGLRILATSREPIGITGETVLSIAPFRVPDPDHLPRSALSNDAIRLFVDRAVRVVPGFEFAADNKVSIARICRQLDGLPLPIELAAARLRAMTPEQILQRLTERYSLLTRGSRGAPSRQQTLRVCVDWSYDLCSPVEQALWAQLSVFAGGFNLRAAEEVCVGDWTPTEFLDGLGCLVDKSILIREGAGTSVRFRMLETLRDYGRGKAREINEKEYILLRRRHRDWCGRLVLAAERDWISPQQTEWITALAREQSNLREALEFCVSDDPVAGRSIAAALYQYWLSQSSFSEGRQWLARFLELDISSKSVERAKALYAATLLAALQGDLAGAATLVAEGRRIAEQATDPVIRAHIDHADGYLALFEENLKRARLLLEKAVQVFTERDIVLFEIIALMGLGMTCEMLNDADRAVECFERVAKTTEVRSEVVYRAYSLRSLAVAVWKQGDRVRAVGLIEQALKLGQEANDRLSVSMCLQTLAWIAIDRKDARRAAVLMGASEEMSRSVGSSTVLLPGVAAYQDACERQAERLLSKRELTAARRRGRALKFRAAVDYALNEHVPHTRFVSAWPSTQPTKRELEVAALITEGLTDKAVAARLVISPRTVHGHVEHLLVKLGFNSRAQIAAWYTESKNDRSEY